LNLIRLYRPNRSRVHSRRGLYLAVRSETNRVWMPSLLSSPRDKPHAFLHFIGFLKIELPKPQPEQNKEYSESVDLPVRLRSVSAFEPEARRSGQHENDTDNLLYLHAATIAQISSSDVRRLSGNWTAS
jgi:hypothetical protein